MCGCLINCWAPGIFTDDTLWAAILWVETPHWWERAQERMAKLVQTAARNATVTKIITFYNHVELKRISKNITLRRISYKRRWPHHKLTKAGQLKIEKKKNRQCFSIFQLSIFGEPANLDQTKTNSRITSHTFCPFRVTFNVVRFIRKKNVAYHVSKTPQVCIRKHTACYKVLTSETPSKNLK